MALPSEYFNSESTILSEDAFLEPSVDITKEINLGNLDLEEFLKDKNKESLPGLTLSPAPKIIPITSTPVQEQKQENNIPTEVDTKKLEDLEKILLGLEEKINSLNNDESVISQDLKKPTAAELLELKLNESSEDNTNTVETVKPQNVNNFETNTNIIDNRRFNQEKIKEFLEQKELLLKQRDDILKSYNNNILNTENNLNSIDNENDYNQINNESLKNEIINSKSISENNLNQNEITKNYLTNDLNQTIVNQQNENSQIPQIVSKKADGIQNILPTEDKINTVESLDEAENINSISNTINDTSTNIFKNTPIEQPEPIFLEKGGIVTEPTNAVIAEAGNPEAVIPLEDIDLEKAMTSSISGEKNSLPANNNEVGEYATEITSLLQRIEKAISGLGETLGSKFNGLNESMKSIKSSTVNNSYNSQQGESGQMNQNKQQQRSPIPNYTGEYADAGDFPPGFDVTKLGGTNLPNPQSIV